MSNQKIPSLIKPFLWSYDYNKLDLQKDKKRILTNVLNFGTKTATNWALNNYSKKDIKEVLKKPMPGEWSPKSLNFWSLVLEVKPGSTKRVLN